jgi:apolipoprotein N-acyltransferase
MRPRRIPVSMLAIAGGVLTTLTLPPIKWWPLAIPGIALLYLAQLQTDRARGRFGLGLLWGAGLYVPSLWWMTAFSLPGGILVGLLEATITAISLWVIVPSNGPPGSQRRTRERNRELSTAAGIVGALMIADSLRSLWPLGGLPLGGIDLGQANGVFAPIVSWLGRLGLVGLVAAISVMAAIALRRTLKLAVAAACIIGLALLPVVARMTAADSTGETTTVRVIQGGGPRGLLASVDNARNTFEAHLEATTDSLTATKPDLVLWPENTVDTAEFATSDRFAALRNLTGTWLSVGITEDAGPTQFVNAQVMISPSGELADRYEKVRRVPFGEYFPLRARIEALGLADLPNRDARPGTTTGILRTDTRTYGVLISYEGFFDDRSRNAVREGAEVILIPTNASSYKTTQLPSHQVAAAQLRAWETNRDVIQNGPTGYSAHVSANGKVTQLTELGERKVFDVNAQIHSGLTPYVRWNDVPALAIAVVLAGLAQLLRWRPQPTSEPLSRALDEVDQLANLDV